VVGLITVAVAAPVAVDGEIDPAIGIAADEGEIVRVVA
jgi:hypothetical protein